MVKFLSIIFFLGFLQFLLGFSKVPVFFVSSCIIIVSTSVCASTGGTGSIPHAQYFYFRI